MGFNSAFKGLRTKAIIVTERKTASLNWKWSAH